MPERPTVAGNAQNHLRYGDVLTKHTELLNAIYNKANEIQRKIVPPSEIPPQCGDEKNDNETSSIFGALVCETGDLLLIDEVLNNILSVL